MAGNWKQMAGAVSLLAFLTSTTAALAQDRRPWIDPPSENGGPAQKTVPPANPTPAPPQANAPEPRPEPVTESAQAKSLSSPPERTSAESTRSKRRIVTRQQPRKTSQAMASAKQKTAFSNRKEAAIERRSTNNIRSTRVREAVNSGLEVMSLRTIEFPDGRRIEVLVRPSPGTLSRLMDESH